jgi:hypothetical protein
MKIVTENYESSIDKLPASGQYIIGHQKGNEIVVYQAYKPAIASFAVANQCLGGTEFSYNRMSWIKPNFLWMMYRCGWAEKENQERVLAIWINKEVLENILQQAVLTSFDSKYFTTHDDWKKELLNKEVRLQWDPDHDPYGNKMTRRAIQLGLSGSLLKNFGSSQINLVEDITDFVKEQKQYLDSKQLHKLLVPVERIYEIDDTLKQKIGISKS